MILKEPKDSSQIKALVPGITTKQEKINFATLDGHRIQLKDEELFYRVQQR